MQSQLTIYDDQANASQTLTTFEDIHNALNDIGVIYERWEANEPLTDKASQEEVLAAYKNDIDTLNARFSFQSIDVVSMQPDNPKKEELRQMFLSEHTHADFEVRFFVDGQGLFYLRPQNTHPNTVLAVHCSKGDLISVPAGMTHWFDMGSEPNFKAIRFFSADNGWVADFTSNNIAERFPLLEC